MKSARLGMCVAAAVVALSSCGDDGEEAPAAGTGGSVSAGGTAAGGGPSAGGASGGSSSGGAASGGASSGGGSSGGASSGGASSGGASSGGASSGGAGGASSGGAASGGASSGALSLTSPVVQDGAEIPARFRCQAPSPALSWSGGPTAQSYAIVFRDVTPGVSNGFLHWLIYDLPPSTMSLPEGVPIGYAVASPAGAHQGKIWNNTVGFNGPCGGNNTYEMTLYALDVATLSELSQSSTGAAVRTAIEAHDVASTKLTILSKP